MASSAAGGIASTLLAGGVAIGGAWMEGLLVANGPEPGCCIGAGPTPDSGSAYRGVVRFSCGRIPASLSPDDTSLMRADTPGGKKCLDAACSQQWASNSCAG